MRPQCIKDNAMPYVLCVQQDFLHIQLKTLMENNTITPLSKKKLQRIWYLNQERSVQSCI